MVKLIPKAETHFENGETHFKNGETHFKNSETHFFGILRKWPLLDFAQKKACTISPYTIFANGKRGQPDIHV